jgi:hypothetical protein
LGRWDSNSTLSGDVTRKDPFFINDLPTNHKTAENNNGMWDAMGNSLFIALFDSSYD